MERKYTKLHTPFAGYTIRTVGRNDAEFTNESRNVSIVNDRLYFTTDVEEGLVEYDLPLLMEFIREGLDYHPRVICSNGVEDFHVNDHHDIVALSSGGELRKVKSLLGIWD